MPVSERKKLSMQKWREANRERLRAYNNTWREQHKEAEAAKAAVRNARYYAAKSADILQRKRERYSELTQEEKQKYCGYSTTDREVWNARNKSWRTNNPGAVAAQVARRRASILRATPGWADMEAIREVYEEAKRLQAQDGVRRHVDHIVPLRGRKVSGLHVHTNLQILTARDNQIKGNQHECV